MHSALPFYFIIDEDGRCDLSLAVKMLIDPLINSQIFPSLLFSFIYPPAVALVFMCMCSPVCIYNKWENIHWVIDSPLHINPCESLPKCPASWERKRERERQGIVEKWERDRKRQTERLGILSIMEAKFNSSWCHQSSRVFFLGRKIFSWKKWRWIAQKAYSTLFLLQFASAFQRQSKLVR